jgi:uncharacterized protein YkwD
MTSSSLVILFLVALASTASTMAAAVDPPPRPVVSGLAQFALNELNEIRHYYHQKPLCFTEELLQAAQVEATKMAAKYNSELSLRKEAAGWTGWNSAFLTEGVEDRGCFGINKLKVADAKTSAEFATRCQFYLSPELLKNMIKPEYTQVGIALVEGKWQKKYPSFTWTQSFSSTTKQACLPAVRPADLHSTEPSA